MGCMDKLSDTRNHIEKDKSYSAVETFAYLLQLKVLKFTCGIGLTMAHLLLNLALKALLFLPIFKEVFGMELLHDSDELVGNLDCQLKRLEEKIDTSRPVA